MLRQNGLKKGTKITSEPIRKQKDIKAISRLLKSRPRDYLLWIAEVKTSGLPVMDPWDQ